MISTSLVTLPMHASFHSSFKLLLAYTTQAWIWNLKTCVMQANICNAHSICNIQVYELAPPTCVLQILIDPLTMSFHLFAPLSYYLCESLSPFGIKYHKRWAQILDRLGWNHIKWGSFSHIWFNLDHLQKIFNLVWSKGKLLHTSK